MIILSRNKGETILIGDDIKVTIAGINNAGVVSVAIEAPKDLSICREEKYQSLKEGLKNLKEISKN